jgi:hypothetical protein
MAVTPAQGILCLVYPPVAIPDYQIEPVTVDAMAVPLVRDWLRAQGGTGYHVGESLTLELVAQYLDADGAAQLLDLSGWGGAWQLRVWHGQTGEEVFTRTSGVIISGTSTEELEVDVENSKFTVSIHHSETMEAGVHRFALQLEDDTDGRGPLFRGLFEAAPEIPLQTTDTPVAPMAGGVSLPPWYKVVTPTGTYVTPIGQQPGVGTHWLWYDYKGSPTLRWHGPGLSYGAEVVIDTGITDTYTLYASDVQWGVEVEVVGPSLPAHDQEAPGWVLD